MQKSLEIARKVRSSIYADLIMRAENSDLTEFALDSSKSELPGSKKRTHLESAKFALGDALNLAIMIPGVLAIAAIDTFTLPIRRNLEPSK